MKVVILAGGYGTRVLEETKDKPKPMIDIGGKPLIWHIMKIYSSYGYNDFILCLGYKSHIIKEWFTNYFFNNSDITINLTDNTIQVHKIITEPWRVTLLETGIEVMTGSRIKKIEQYINGEPFLLTYGDGVGNININELINYHNKNNKILTVTATKAKGQFGKLILNEKSEVISFKEKKDNEDIWINSGFFVCKPELLNYIEYNNDSIIFEKDTIQKITTQNEMVAYKHTGFWKPLDSLQDKIYLNNLWNIKEAPWKVWDD